MAVGNNEEGGLPLRDLHLPSEVLAFAATIRRIGGTVYLVGGWVRDYLRGVANADFDLEVYGVQQTELMESIARHGQADLVGRSFGIIKARFGRIHCDIGFPRTESKTGRGHRGFLVTPDPHLTFQQASSRRDFTINSMGIRLPDEVLVDPHGGQRDLRDGILRHVSSAFAEDPLRVLRGIQFAARFEMRMASETIAFCRQLPLDELSRERVYGELHKLFHLAARPSVGLRLMEETDTLRYFPELAALRGTPQDPEKHPEGDVWDHTLCVMDEAATLRDDIHDPVEREVFLLACLCHDLGKPGTTVRVDGRWTSPGHTEKGVERSEAFLGRILGSPDRIIGVTTLVREHMVPKQLYQARAQVSDAAIRRLAQRVSIRLLEKVSRADHLGRRFVDAQRRAFPAGDWLLRRARELGVLEGPEPPFLRGRHLLAMGVPPGPHLGPVLDEAYHLQTEGILRNVEDAIAWARETLKG